MAEEAEENVTLTCQLMLIDYLALQMWCRRHYLARSFSIFVAFVVGIIVFVDLASGMTLTEIVRVALLDWKLYMITVLGGYLVTATVPFLAITLRWVGNKLSREMRISVDISGLRYSTADHELGFQWSSLQFLTEDKSAYFAKFAKFVVRIPKRGFTALQLARFVDIVRKVVPANANKIQPLAIL